MCVYKILEYDCSVPSIETEYGVRNHTLYSRALPFLYVTILLFELLVFQFLRIDSILLRLSDRELVVVHFVLLI